jgi:hypothetical protein
MVSSYGRLWRSCAAVPSIGQCPKGGYGWLEVMCHRCETRASLPPDAIRHPRDTPIWKLEAAVRMHRNIGRDLLLLREPDHVHRRRISRHPA